MAESAHPQSDVSPPSRDGDFGWLRAQLTELASANLLRCPLEVMGAQGPSLTVRGDDGRPRECVNFCSNNYLNLAADPRIRHAARDAIDRWGFGSGASRLISGTTTLHRRAERDIADFLGTDDAILLGAGYMTNVAAVTALAGPGDALILDKLCHASLIDAARQSGARLRVYPHGDMDRLEALLARSQTSARRSLVLTDSLFSMDGDFSPLSRIAAMKDDFRFTLIVDEAHAIGVHGAGGAGVAELLGLRQAIDVTVGTCSKALGGFGGFVAGRETLIDALRNTARPFIFSTAPPAAIAAAAIAALEVIRAEPERRRRLLTLAERFRSELAQAGWDIGASCSQIIPVVWGSPAKALAAQQALLQRGLFVAAIRPPSVPRGSSRLRVSLMCDHGEADLRRLICGLADVRDRVGPPDPAQP